MKAVVLEREAAFSDDCSSRREGRILNSEEFACGVFRRWGLYSNEQTQGRLQLKFRDPSPARLVIVT